LVRRLLLTSGRQGSKQSDMDTVHDALCVYACQYNDEKNGCNNESGRAVFVLGTLVSAA
jgi:hypothetical protein